MLAELNEIVNKAVDANPVLGLKALKRSAWVEAVGPGTRLEIQVLEPAAVHVLLVAQLTRWLDGSATNPADLVKKKRLKELLAS